MKLIILLLVSSTSAKIFQRCELTKELHERHQIPKRESGMFACIGEAHSRLNTSAIVGAATPELGTQYHGLFQFSDEFWCSLKGEKKLCGMTCDALRDDDITNDVYCAWYHVFVEHERLSGDGFDAWNANKYCQKHLNKFMRCFDEPLEIDTGSVRINGSTSISQTTKGKTTTKSITQRTTTKPRSTTTTTRTTTVGKSQKITQGKKYQRCELAKELYEKYDVEWEQLPTVVCLASHESGFKTTQTKVSNFDGSTTYGIFQINDKRWCSNGSPGGGCNLECDSLRDGNLEDDVDCLKWMFKVGQLLSQEWTSYDKCTGDNIWDYVEGCFTYDESTESPTTTTTKVTSVTKQKTSRKTTPTKKITTRTTTRSPVIQNHRFQLELSPEPVTSTHNPLETIVEPALNLLPPEEDTTEAPTTIRTTTRTTRTTSRTTTPRRTTTRRVQFPFFNFLQQQFGVTTQKPVEVPDLTLSLLAPDVSYDVIHNPESSFLVFDTISVPRATWNEYDEELPSVTVKPFSVDYVKRLTIPPRRISNQFFV